MLRRRDEVEAVDGVCIGCFLLFIFLLSMMFWIPSHRRHKTPLVEVTPMTDLITSTSTPKLETKDRLENWKGKRKGSGTESSLNTGQKLKESLEQLSQQIQNIKEQIGIKTQEIIDSQDMTEDDYITKNSTTISPSTEKRQETRINRDNLRDLTQRRLRDDLFQQPIWIR